MTTRTDLLSLTVSPNVVINVSFGTYLLIVRSTLQLVLMVFGRKRDKREVDTASHEVLKLDVDNLKRW